MTNPINLEETYNELSKLLKDLCGFISKEVQNGTLSLDATSQAQNLLQRIQKQEEVVNKIATIQEISNSNYPYLQMQRPVLMEEPLSIYVDADHIEEEMYELTLNKTDELFDYPSPSPTGIDTCPYLELPLTSLPEKAVKYGPLIRKEKYFIIEQKKHLIVGLVGYWLLIYHANKKDVKPTQVLNMVEYKAQIKKEPVFEIVSENKKTHEFTAKSVKDMDQWIVAINCKIHRKSNIRNLPDVPQYKSSKENIIDNANISLSSTCNDNESEIYENIDETRKLEHGTHIEEDIDQNAPKLPARKPDYIRRIDFTTTNYISDKKTDKYNGDGMRDSVEEEAEDEDFYDELRIIDTIDTQKMKTTNPPISKLATSLSENNYNNKGNSYNTHTSSINKNDVDSEEEVEYDELKFNSHNNFEISTESNTPEFEKSSKTSKTDILKPMVTSPKPINTEARNSQEKNNTGNSYNSHASNISKNNVETEDEEVEYDELNTPELVINTYTPKQILSKPIVTSPKQKNIESKNIQEKNNSGNCCNSRTSTTNKNNVDSEDEETEYDELKYNSQNNYEISKQTNNTSEFEINIKSPKKVTLKPIVTSPKPKILESKKSEGKINPSRIHNLIQQMEASSLLKKKK